MCVFNTPIIIINIDGTRKILTKKKLVLTSSLLQHYVHWHYIYFYLYYWIMVTKQKQKKISMIIFRVTFHGKHTYTHTYIWIHHHHHNHHLHICANWFVSSSFVLIILVLFGTFFSSIVIINVDRLNAFLFLERGN